MQEEYITSMDDNENLSKKSLTNSSAML